MEKVIGIKKSLELLDSFFSSRKIEFWLEAGTALAAYRDGKVFPWEHDIDVAIWREEIPDLKELTKFFQDKNFEVIIQKSLPFLDNIIQLKVINREVNDVFDIDIYLYSRKDNFAYMRWIQKPEGILGPIKKKTLILIRNLVNPLTNKWRNLSKFIPSIFIDNFFKLYLELHIFSSSCIYHRFPAQYFDDLKDINFYGVKVKIPNDTEKFLSHRYGVNWKTPDSKFNQTGKWKKSGARVLLPMKLLPTPIFDKNLIKLK
jgi:phosphorylcholine metabolism protein LicD